MLLVPGLSAFFVIFFQRIPVVAELLCHIHLFRGGSKHGSALPGLQAHLRAMVRVPVAAHLAVHVFDSLLARGVLLVRRGEAGLLLDSKGFERLIVQHQEVVLVVLRSLGCLFLLRLCRVWRRLSLLLQRLNMAHGLDDDKETQDNERHKADPDYALSLTPMMPWDGALVAAGCFHKGSAFQWLPSIGQTYLVPHSHYLLLIAPRPRPRPRPP
ncbi:hypothetical protein BKA81DRAFT_373392 [Phyllosticta paracitricarpa]